MDKSMLLMPYMQFKVPIIGHFTCKRVYGPVRITILQKIYSK